MKGWDGGRGGQIDLRLPQGKTTFKKPSLIRVKWRVKTYDTLDVFYEKDVFYENGFFYKGCFLRK